MIINDNLLISITSWLGIVGVVVCILAGHNGVLISILAGINLSGIGITTGNIIRKRIQNKSGGVTNGE